jgi:hypothetical protein
MLGASTNAVLDDRPPQATGEEPAKRLRVDVVIQGADLELDPLRGAMVQQPDAVADGAVAKGHVWPIRPDDARTGSATPGGG